MSAAQEEVLRIAAAHGWGVMVCEGEIELIGDGVSAAAPTWSALLPLARLAELSNAGLAAA